MNTFLPYPDFQESAKCLDNKRLGKQRIETWQIYNAIITGSITHCKRCNGKGYLEIYSDEKLICSKCKGKGRYKTGWYNHPITLMWKDYKLALLLYGIEICREWIERGFIDNMLGIFAREKSAYLYRFIKYPFWLGDEEVHRGYRSNLLRKDYIYYSKFNWKEPLNLPYKWIMK